MEASSTSDRTEVDPELAALLVESAPDALLVVDRTGVIRQVNRRVEELFGYGRDGMLGQQIEILLPESVRQVHTAHRLRYVADPLVRPMGLDLDLWGRRADGAEFPVEISLSPCALRGERLVIAAIRDVSARRAVEQSMRNLLQMLEGISEAVYLVEPDTLALTYVNNAACHQTGYGRDDLLTMTPLHVAPELDETEWRSITDELTGDPAAAHTVVTTLRRRDGVDVRVECTVSLPAALRGQPPMLVLIVRDITEREAHAAQALATAELVTLVNERERLARDLHDTVIQDLFASGLLLQSVTMRSGGDHDPRVDEVIDRLDASILQIRSVIFRLGNHGGSQQGLLGQVHGVLEEAARILGSQPILRTSGPIDTMASPALVEQLIPTLRESLSNVARHARATRVEVGVELVDDLVTLTVVDNGIGYDAARPRGHGVRNMGERARRLGGDMSIGPREPAGTTMVWTARLG